MTSAELIAELRAARPVADGALRERLRAIAAEPKRRPARFAGFSRRRFALVAVPALAVVAVSVAGVVGLVDSGPGLPETAASSRGALAQSPPGGSTATELAPQAKAGATTDSAAVPAATPGRAQRYAAQLTVEVKDVDALSNATQRALRTARDLGGYVVNVAYATSTNGTSTMTLRVPTARVQDAIVQLSGLGRIVSQQVQIDDLQGQVDELTKRESALRERIARLSARLASTSLDAETRATLEARRDAARADLGRVRTARAQVNGEARFATIQLTVQTKEQSVVPVTSSRWDRGVDRAARILAVEATVVLAALAAGAPLALLGLGIWLARRGVRRRHDERLLSAQ